MVVTFDEEGVVDGGAAVVDGGAAVPVVDGGATAFDGGAAVVDEERVIAVGAIDEDEPGEGTLLEAAKPGAVTLGVRLVLRLPDVPA